jgi:chromosome segregation protein
MEDVIFNGTAVRKPLGMAEVSLIIGGLDSLRLEGLSGLSTQLSEFQELMITRRLYRNGDSEYLINKTSCRLKDIRSVLLDTRAGTKGHTVIEQGRLDQILNASPHDRRELIEETAGIVRYKKQKAEALRKLESTQQNLLRVRDIIAEVKKQLNSLERQARQARNYQVLQNEARALEIALLAREHRALRSGLDTIAAESAELEMKEAAQAAEQARSDAALEERRASMLAAGDQVNKIREELAKVEQQQAQALTTVEVERSREELFEQQRLLAEQELLRLETEGRTAAAEGDAVRRRLAELADELADREQLVSRLEKEHADHMKHRATVLAEEDRARQDIVNLTVLASNTEQALTELGRREQEAAAQIGRIQTEQATLDERRREHQERCAGLRRRVDELAQGLRSLRDRQDQAQELAERLAGALTEADGQLARRSEDLAAVDSRLRALHSIVQEEMGYGRSGEEGTALKTCAGVQEALAEWLVVPPGLDRAVEAVMGDRLRGWLVEETAAAQEAIRFLKNKELGRGTFIPRTLRSTQHRREASWWPSLSEEAGVLGRADALVQSTSLAAGVMTYLFGGVVIVETLEHAVRLWKKRAFADGEGATLVTLTGEILEPSGVVVGGGGSSSGGVLQRRREILTLEAERERLIGALEAGRQQRQTVADRLASVRAEAKETAEALRQAELDHVSAEKDLGGLDQALSVFTQETDELARQLRSGRDEIQRAKQEVHVIQAQSEQWRREKTGQETVLAQVQARLQSLEVDSTALQERLTEARLAAEGLRVRREHAEADLSRLQQQSAHAASRGQSLQQQVTSLMASLRQSREERQRYEALCRELGATASQVQVRLVQAQEVQAERLAEAQRVEQLLSELRATIASLREARMAIEVRRAELRTQLTTVESTLTGTYHIRVEAIEDHRDARLVETTSAQGENESQEATDAQLREQLQKIRERLDRMGPINLAAIDEHRELEERYRFLSTQEEDLSKSIASLKEIIHRINKTTKEMFLSTFTELQQKFDEVFTKFFPGGRAELVLVDEPVEEGMPVGGQEPGVDIVAQPPGKRLKNITMLSGGEKTLTAMALLFASFLIRPTPFCVLDEIDAPLDEENIGRFTSVLRQLASDAQFLVITHNKRTMSIADSLFGVTMEEPGISKMVSVRLTDLQPA